MKTKLLFLLLITTVCTCLCLTSCSEDDITVTDQTSNTELSLRMAGDGKWDILGFGYDITDEYLGERSYRNMIINVEAFKKDYPNYIYDDATGGSATRLYGGSDCLDFLNDITVQTNFKNSIAGTNIKDGDKSKAVFAASINADYTVDTNNKYTYSSKYSFARAEKLAYVGHYFFTLDHTILSKYVYPEFLNDLNRLSPDAFVKMYGTHVLCDITIGGTYSLYYRSSIINTKDASLKKTTVKTGASLTLYYVTLGSDKSTTTTQLEEVEKETSTWNVYIKRKGGSNSGENMSFDYKTGRPSSLSINFGEWEKSVTKYNAGLVDVNWDRTYPIYYLISDPIKKEAIKQAVARYLEAKKLDALKLSPLYVFYDKTLKQHITTNRELAKDAPSRYQMKGVTGYVCDNKDPLTCALYEWEKPNGYIATTTNSNMTIYDKTYKIKNIAGYVYYNVPYLNTVPLWAYSSNQAPLYEQATATDPTLLTNRQYYTQSSYDVGFIYPSK